MQKIKLFVWSSISITRWRSNFIFSVPHDMQMVRKLHCRSAVLKCFGFGTLHTANFLKVLLLLGDTIINKLANHGICFYRVHEITMVFYIFKGLFKKKNRPVTKNGPTRFYVSHQPRLCLTGPRMLTLTPIALKRAGCLRGSSTISFI